MEKKQLYRIGVIAGVALAVAHYYMTVFTFFYEFNTYEYIRELAQENTYVFFWPQIALSVMTVVAIFTSNKGDSVFVITIITSLAFAVEIFFAGSEVSEERYNYDLMPFFVCAAGVVIMLVCAYSLKKLDGPEAPQKPAMSHSNEAPSNKEANKDTLDETDKGEKTIEVPLSDVDHSEAYIEFLSGELQGAKLEMTDKIIIGKSAEMCNIILSNPKCSRVHCTVKYDREKALFVVRDMSTNGLFIENVGRLTKDMDYEVHRGTILSIGDTEDRFKLY